ncbi:aldo/keto reductase [Oceanobacillus sp. CAU 1775]
MEKNQLGSSDIYITELTLGCMSLGKDKQTAKEIIETALDKGINHLDTADLYDFGLNEELIGEIIKEYRQDIILTTKVGNHFNKQEENWFWDPSKKYIVNTVKDSLKRLKTDYIDLYMLHGGTIEDPIDETIEAFEQLKTEGLIRTYGISSIRPNVIREYVEKSSIDAVMLQYSLFDRRPEEAVLDLLKENQISVLARGPFAKGMLSNRGEKQINKKARDGYLDYTQDELLDSYNQITTMADDSYTINELALKYVLNHPAVTSTVFGASSVQQVNENTTIFNQKKLPEDLYHQLQNITKSNKYTAHR